MPKKRKKEFYSCKKMCEGGDPRLGCHQEKTFSVLSPLARHQKATEEDQHPAGYLEARGV